MIPIAIAFLILVVLLVRQYGGHRLAVYLIALVLFWLTCFATSVLIIGNQSAFFLLGPRLLPMDWFLIRRMPVPNNRSSILITILNTSTAGFYFFFLAFSLRFSHPTGKAAKSLIWLLAIPVLLVVVAFDPVFIRMISRINATAAAHRFISLTPVFRAAQLISRIVFGSYLLAGIVVLMIYCWDRPRTRRIQRSITYMAIAVSLFGGMFAFFFYRSPQLLVIPTFREPYVRIGFYEIPTTVQLLRAFPLAQVFVMIALLVGVARFLSLASSNSFYDTRIRHTLRAASLGSRVIGHAVKNQLFAIESQLNSLRSEIPAEYPDVARKLTTMAGMCRQTYNSMGKTIEMLRVPKLRMRLCNLVSIVGSSVSSWSSVSLDADVSFHAMKSDAPAYADPAHFDEVLHNLLNNAREASTDSPSTLIFVEVIVDNFWIYVHITDHGRGLTGPEATHLFDPFYTEHSSASNWGVGLTYCRRIIDAHDGSIDIRNSENAGARVELSIPRAQPWQ